MNEKLVAIACADEMPRYPVKAPYDADTTFPELLQRPPANPERNLTFHLFRRLLRDLQLDSDSYGTDHWNPFGVFISPGHTVVLKPNLVRDLHMGGGPIEVVVTHGSVVRCALEYVAIALKGRGQIFVADAPVQSADWLKILERTGLKEVCDNVSKTWEIPVRLVDFRLWAVQLDDNHCIVKSNSLKGDPNGYVAVDLGKRSLLAPLGNQSDKFRVTNYDCEGMRLHHNETTNEYLIPRTVLEADVVINLPKLKTHRKVGMTAALKNIVGINGHKDWLPHHRCGSVAEGGDEYKEPSFLKRLQTRLGEKVDQEPYSNRNFLRRFAINAADRLSRFIAPDPYYEGSWYGNDTLWRTVLDLNRLLVYASKEGRMTETPQRKCLNIIDAIIAGDGEGPMEPDPRPLGLLIGGINPVAVDAVLATIIGFNYKKIPIIARGFELEDWPLVDFRPQGIVIHSQDPRWKFLKVGTPSNAFRLKPPSGWVDHIENGLVHR